MDLDDVAPSWLMRAASLSLLVAGGLRGIVGLQLVTFVRLGGMWWWVPYAMMALGGAAALCGALSARGTLRPVLAGAVLGPLLAVLGLAWEIYAIPRGLLSPLSVSAAGVSLLCGALAPAAVPSARSVDAARRRLLE